METWILFLVKAFSSGTPILYGTLARSSMKSPVT